MYYQHVKTNVVGYSQVNNYIYILINHIKSMHISEICIEFKR